MDIIGELIFKRDTQTISEKFKKREFILKTDDQYPQEIQFELVQDGCSLIDTFKVGEKVRVFFNIRGRGWVNAEGKKVWFNTLNTWKIQLIQGQDNEESVSESDPNSEINTTNPPDDLPF